MNTISIKQVFLLLLALTYIALGIFIFTMKAVPYPPWSEILAGMFVLYGSWRAYRAMTKK